MTESGEDLIVSLGLFGRILSWSSEVGSVVDPFARGRDPLAGGDRCCVSHQRNEVTVATRFGAQDAEAIFDIMIGDSLDQTGQYLLG